MAARLIASVFFVFLSIPAFADTLTDKLVKITDGDTLYVLDATYGQPHDFCATLGPLT